MSARSAELAQEARDSVLRQVKLALSEQGGDMLLLLDPPELGSVGIRMQIVGRELRLQLTGDREEVAAILETGRSALLQTLTAQGFTVGEFDVRSGSRQDLEHQARDFDARWRNGGVVGTGDASAVQQAVVPAIVTFSGTGIDFIA